MDRNGGTKSVVLSSRLRYNNIKIKVEMKNNVVSRMKQLKRERKFFCLPEIEQDFFGGHLKFSRGIDNVHPFPVRVGVREARSRDLKVYNSRTTEVRNLFRVHLLILQIFVSNSNPISVLLSLLSRLHVE